jgi:hypothetical protein
VLNFCIMSHEISQHSGEEAYLQAQAEVPYKWIEPKDGMQPTLLATAALNAAALAEIGQVYPPTLPFMITSAAVYVASAIADHKSTVNAFSAMNCAEEVGVPPHHAESSIFMHGETRAENIKGNKTFIAANIVGTAISTLPVVGIPLSVMKFRAALANRRTEKVYRRATEIVENAKK